tara:strand:+ start:178 stop:426 length:249 start_codon:yes stop_codon:yes gene_type:complete
MVNLDKEGLEKAFSDGEVKTGSDDDAGAGFKNQDEEIGFHKGAINTLAAERNELVKMIGNVEAIMQAHLKRLEELGVDVKKQ